MPRGRNTFQHNPNIKVILNIFLINLTVNRVIFNPNFLKEIREIAKKASLSTLFTKITRKPSKKPKINK